MIAFRLPGARCHPFRSARPTFASPFGLVLLAATATLCHGGDREDFFERRIRPVLVAECYSCHSAEADKSEGGLLLDSAAALQRGGDSGPALIAGKPAESLLLEAIRYESLEMPPDGKLDDAVIADFERWIAAGAVDPRQEETTPTATEPKEIDWEEERAYWAFQPPGKPRVPHDTRWDRGAIDAFVRTRLAEHDLQPAAEADRPTWLRRVTFDLTGLPPTPAELDAFLADTRPGAYARVVDRLLASPAYGEHWGRYWLDLARYADSNGADENHPYPVAWRYRDYVVQALNDDMPYDQFVHEQLAGDLLPADSRKDRHRQLTATGFLVLGPKMLAEQDKEKLVADIVDEQIDVVGQVFLGLTLGCARCHDHKFDPITTKDYYALAGIFHSTKTMEHLDHVSQWMERGLPDPATQAAIDAHQKRIDEAKQRVASIEAEEASDSQKQRLEEAKKEVERLEESKPQLERVMAVDDDDLKLVPVHVRGNHLQFSGDPLPRRIPTIFRSSPKAVPEFPTSSSGRLELAQWLTEPEHPLTARVMANRVWMGHFGRGLVDSPSNFGRRGEAPTHPRLLDWLAEEFVSHDWSIKRLHREIVLSSVYRMQWTSNRQAERQDPANALLWRQNRRRLRAEAIRDLLLCIADELDRTMGAKATDLSEMHFPESNIARNAFNGPRRTLYLSINRAALDDFFSTFDYVDPAASLEKRPATTVPHQTLFLMNHPLAMHAAWRLAQRVTDAATDRDERIEAAYKILFTRSPTTAEQSAGRAFLATNDGEEASRAAESEFDAWVAYCRALLLTNELLYVD